MEEKVIINPETEQHFKNNQAQEIEFVREAIRTLPRRIQRLVSEGEVTIDDWLRRTWQDDPSRSSELNGVNVFDLRQDVPGEVMKHLAMLYTAAGFHHVSVSCDCFSSEGSPRKVTFPNVIVMNHKR